MKHKRGQQYEEKGEAGSRPGREHETKRAPFEVSKVNEAGSFEGYASLFDREDLGHDLVERGAFTRSLEKRRASGVRMLFQHDPADPIGVWEIIREDDKGLYVKGHLTLEVARAREVHALMKAGALDGLSIGFHTVKAVKNRSTGTRHLVEIDLWEISVVTFPMQPEARVSLVKAARHPTERELEYRLTRNIRLSRQQARALIAGGYKAAFAGRDARTSAADLFGLARDLREAGRHFIH
ncbi:MAG: HK97 family phage prohead protease [Alphaproteobacteria bacterium]|nr:HK97 family phage prohead protease [Alphaproteobacteria bacterium]MBO6628890.1 HK97 family phage prohead protease [Alphaproteobacteria bacterium]MDF1625909.1 HK97 family phage prohead protease [Parvibaculaceae bacterium]